MLVIGEPKDGQEMAAEKQRKRRLPVSVGTREWPQENTWPCCPGWVLKLGGHGLVGEHLWPPISESGSS